MTPFFPWTKLPQHKQIARKFIHLSIDYAHLRAEQHQNANQLQETTDYIHMGARLLHLSNCIYQLHTPQYSEALYNRLTSPTDAQRPGSTGHPPTAPSLIPYAYDDGGRAAAGFTSPTGDCVVRAIAILTGTPYIHVHHRMAAAIRRAGYSPSEHAHRHKPRPNLKPRISPLGVQHLVQASYGLYYANLGRGRLPTFSEAYRLYGDCLVATPDHMSAIVNGTLRDTFDSRFCERPPKRGPKDDQQRAEAIWLRRKPDHPASSTHWSHHAKKIPAPKRIRP